MGKQMIEVTHVTKMYKMYDNEKDRILEAMFPWKKRSIGNFMR